MEIRYSKTALKVLSKVAPFTGAWIEIARFEKEADRFAAYLLLSQYSKCTFENCDIYQISAVSAETDL